ncbi:MAG: hypothetical protein DBX52_06555 [Clostridiales bacterium]|nr:MAG: hypothetical protein DBX52_06555 [Clostridiales bacterium]
MEETTALFTEALREYNREEMAVYLTQFPDNTAYVYLDDIFNDTGYIELYRMLYPNITYSIQSFEKNRAVIEYTMPNIQKLYTNVSAAVLNLALTDETLQQKLAENDENGIILIREMMLYYASSGNGIENMTQQFTLTFQKKEGRIVIVCDDALRALITGNFFLSKNMTQESIEQKQ